MTNEEMLHTLALCKEETLKVAVEYIIDILEALIGREQKAEARHETIDGVLRVDILDQRTGDTYHSDVAFEDGQSLFILGRRVWPPIETEQKEEVGGEAHDLVMDLCLYERLEYEAAQEMMIPIGSVGANTEAIRRNRDHQIELMKIRARILDYYDRHKGSEGG